MSPMSLWRDATRTPHQRQCVAIGTVAILMGAAMAIHIQTQWDLYRTSMTMTLVGIATALIGMAILWLLDGRRYVSAWAVTLIVPPIVFVVVLRLLERFPPDAPMG